MIDKLDSIGFDWGYRKRKRESSSDSLTTKSTEFGFDDILKKRRKSNNSSKQELENEFDIELEDDLDPVLLHTNYQFEEQVLTKEEEEEKKKFEDACKSLESFLETFKCFSSIQMQRLREIIQKGEVKEDEFDKLDEVALNDKFTA